MECSGALVKPHYYYYLPMSLIYIYRPTLIGINDIYLSIGLVKKNNTCCIYAAAFSTRPVVLKVVNM